MEYLIQMYRWLMLAPLLIACGCGTTNSRMATEQILVSDAVDRSVANIDFSSLAGEKVYLDTKYIKLIKGMGFVNADYIVSSLRQQLVAANCYMQEKLTDADYVVEARVGALGTDMHEMTYGIPASNSLTAAANLLPNAPIVPSIPELAIAKRNDHYGAAKVAVFAYHRTTGERVWQSGTSLASSRSKDWWLFGAGPFQTGTIYEGTRFAGDQIRLPFSRGEKPTQEHRVVFADERYFGKSGPHPKVNPVQIINYEQLVPVNSTAPPNRDGDPKSPVPKELPPLPAKP
ncbi:MAG: hypothetical protein ACI9G1_005608 [Pirellulaceae bacterium]|jgi:hypothetical protein